MEDGSDVFGNLPALEAYESEEEEEEGEGEEQAEGEGSPEVEAVEEKKSGPSQEDEPRIEEEKI
jgi:hypothetical protein